MARLLIRDRHGAEQRLRLNPETDQADHADRGIGLHRPPRVALCPSILTDRPEHGGSRRRNQHPIQVSAIRVHIVGLMADPQIVPTLAGIPAGVLWLDADHRGVRI